MVLDPTGMKRLTLYEITSKGSLENIMGNIDYLHGRQIAMVNSVTGNSNNT